ncbi:MAG: HAD-IA family hydrolase, partial [Bacteroidales bacterium]
AKPDPEIFLKAAAAIQTEPSGCVVFEDAIAGVEAAHRAGMRCVGVGNPQTLSDADRVIADFTDADLSLLAF